MGEVAMIDKLSQRLIQLMQVNWNRLLTNHVWFFSIDRVDLEINKLCIKTN